MRNTRKVQAMVVACILSLLMTLIPVTELNAANITIEYSQSLDNIVAQLNNKLGIQSTADNWTFNTNATAELTCTSFIMHYNGKSMQMLSMLKPKYEGTDAYNIYNQYMADFTNQESGWQYCPIRSNRADIPEKTVDMGEVAYNIQTPMQFNGSSHTIIKYAGTLRYTSFLDTIAVGSTVSMQYNGTAHSVKFVDKVEAAPPTTGGDSASAPSAPGNSSQGNSATSGNVSSTGTGSNYVGGLGTKIEIFDSATSNPNDTTTSSTTIIPGRTQISSEQILESTLNQVKPSEKDDKKPEKEDEEQEPGVDVEESLDDVVMEEVMIESQGEPVFYIYETEEMSVDQEGRADTLCTVSMTGIAGAGLIRLLMLFMKMKK